MNSTPAAATPELGSKRINDFQEYELIEIGIPGADSPDAMLAHKNSRVSIVQQIASEMRQLQNHFAGDVCMTLSRDENGEAWRSEQRRYEFPRCWGAPRPSHHPWMGCYPQKLVEYPPGRVPSIRPRPLAFKPVAAGDMKLRVSICGINQHISIDYEH